MSRFWSNLVNRLIPYIPGEQPNAQNLIKLNTNENPFAPSPQAIHAIQEVTKSTGKALKYYPDPNSAELKQAIAQYCSVSESQVFVGNGSDEVLAHVFQALLKHSKPLLFPDISYSFYPTYCKLYDIKSKLVPLTTSFEIQIEDYLQPNGGIIFPNPNAPTGKLLNLNAIEKLLNLNPDSVVVVDEAYIDFGGETAIPFIKDYDNLLVVQTFSKSRSLAGLRIGFAIGQTHLIEALEKVKNSFNSYSLDLLAIKAGTASLQDETYFKKTCQTIINTREKTLKALNKLGFESLPSMANFIFTKHNRLQAEDIAAQLREQSIIVRYFNKPRINQYLRITIGTEADMQQLIKVLQSICHPNQKDF